MGVIDCYIHGDAVVVRPACKHVIDNIDKGINEKCFSVRVRPLPGELISENEAGEGRYIIHIPFCLQCYEDKKMSTRMKLIADKDSVDKAIKDFDVSWGCALCIERYTEENKLN